MGTTESFPHASDTTASIPTLAEPFGKVIHQYTDTLCGSQKQTNLTNLLLQDITVFNITIHQSWKNG